MTPTTSSSLMRTATATPTPTPMDILPSLGTDIFSTVRPTMGLYFQAHAEKDQDAVAARDGDGDDKQQEDEEVKEIKYGPEKRQVFDLYLPSSGDQKQQPAPAKWKRTRKTIIFVHGGGLDKGDKRMILPAVTPQKKKKSYIYGNVGRFWAERGYISIVINYRLRIPDSASPEYSTSANARFPSGGEDISRLLTFLSESNPTTRTMMQQSGFNRDQVYLMGNSAGAVHIATYLYRDAIPSFSEVSPSETNTGNEQQEQEHSIPRPTITPRAVIFISPPVAFGTMNPERTKTIYGYYGLLGDNHKDEVQGGEQNKDTEEEEEKKKKKLEELAPLGLRYRSKDETKVLLCLAELDPEDEILEPCRRFLQAHRQATEGSDIETLIIKGHNHISVPWGLGLGGKEEQWGEDVDEWIGKN